MDGSNLPHCLTDAERLEFDRNGFLAVENALPNDLVERLTQVVDRIDENHRSEHGVSLHDRVNHLDFVGQDALFLELLDWPKTFSKVWGILGVEHSTLPFTYGGLSTATCRRQTGKCPVCNPSGF